MVISAEDMARFGLLTLNRGRWNGKQRLSEDWVKRIDPDRRQPWLRIHELVPEHRPQDAPQRTRKRVLSHRQRRHVIYVDPELDMVAVLRWIEQPQLDGFVARLRSAAK